ncbi:hypothetical protein L2E82_48021 [Cichorium intybus]|uniref:Uncharacterized protein n=1 Tax=Cichorium intybus TaxID=13427 RepID=A0ACB8YXU2_CICIN|nr:hypothetical protein L2E82_48021 [Cichorium intybus]
MTCGTIKSLQICLPLLHHRPCLHHLRQFLWTVEPPVETIPSFAHSYKNSQIVSSTRSKPSNTNSSRYYANSSWGS